MRKRTHNFTRALDAGDVDEGSFMLGLHYVPGDHGSMKRSSPWCFGHFSSCSSSLPSLVTFCHGLSRYPWRTVGC